MASSNLILIVALFSVLGLASVNVDEVVDPCEESSFSHLDAVPFCSHLDPLRGLSSSMGIPSRSSIGAPSISSSAPSSFFFVIGLTSQKRGKETINNGLLPQRPLFPSS